MPIFLLLCSTPTDYPDNVQGGDAALHEANAHEQNDIQSSESECSRSPLYRRGLRSFFVYRDTGVTAATNGKIRVQMVRAAHKSSEAKGGTGFHFDTADAHVVYMVRGWARFDYDGVNTLVEAGDCVHQRPGIVHSLYDWSDDMEFMEIIMPGDFATTEITPPAALATAPAEVNR
jgi:quercetin dioxygenase-like cupin family protein